jgi:hypothetical protein
MDQICRPVNLDFREPGILQMLNDSIFGEHAHFEG